MPGRVSTRRQFDRLAATEGKGRGGPLRVRFVASEDPAESFAVAYAIGRRVGGAVSRNRLRRRLRALMDELRPTLTPGLYLIKCDFQPKELDYEDLRSHLTAALEAAGARR